MRLHFETFDCIWGVIVGVVLIGLAGTFFMLPDMPMIWGVFFGISAVTTIIDVVLCLKDFHDMHKGLLAGIVVSSIVYFIVELGMVAKYFIVNIPFITSSVVPILGNAVFLLGIGAFFVVTSVIWLIDSLRAGL